jgi:hypothetical protein
MTSLPPIYDEGESKSITGCGRVESGELLRGKQENLNCRQRSGQEPPYLTARARFCRDIPPEAHSSCGQDSRQPYQSTEVCIELDLF